MSVNIGLTLGFWGVGRKGAGAEPEPVLVTEGSRSSTRGFPGLPTVSSSVSVSIQRSLCGLVQRMIRRERRSLCFDRVTAAAVGGVCCRFSAHAQNCTAS